MFTFLSPGTSITVKIFSTPQIHS